METLQTEERATEERPVEEEELAAEKGTGPEEGQGTEKSRVQPDRRLTREELQALEEELACVSGEDGEEDLGACGRIFEDDDDEGEEDGGAEGERDAYAPWDPLCHMLSPDRPRSRDITTKQLGARGEDAAAAYLERRGYQVLERNWTCRFGEADIIAVDDEGTIVFVEVKTRRSLERGLPEEAITPEKRRRYEKIALAYMMEADWDDCVALRFDAIGICVTGDFTAILKHHKGCFDGL